MISCFALTLRSSFTIEPMRIGELAERAGTMTQLQAVGFTLDDTRPFIECLRSGHETGDSCVDSIEVYQRKLAEVDVCLDRLGSVRATLHATLAEALTRQHGPCFTADPGVVTDRNNANPPQI